MYERRSRDQKPKMSSISSFLFFLFLSVTLASPATRFEDCFCFAAGVWDSLSFEVDARTKTASVV